MQNTLPIAVLCCLMAGPVLPQVAQLSEHVTGERKIEAALGDTIQIDLSIDLAAYRASGVTVYMRVPAEGFRVLDSGGAGAPFLPGDLFSDGLVVRNQDVTPTEQAQPYRLLEFSTLLGPGSARDRRGSGSVACVRVVCEKQTSGEFLVLHTPVYESRIVLQDGRSERPLYLGPPVEIHVDVDTGVEALGWGQVKTESANR